jgi:uncharacterized heparinase superfamily protein
MHYARTVSHLKLRQITYQLIHRFGSQTNLAPIIESIALRQGVALAQPLYRRKGGEENTFIFLNRIKRFDPAHFDWSATEMCKLWRYNLHYFDYLHEKWRSWDSLAFLLNDWLKSNPQGTPDAWEPFPVSLRIVNWIKFFFALEAKGKLKEQWLQNLYRQVLWLEKNIEYHLLANHYFKNGKSLIFAGLFFSGKDAQRWLNKGLAIITKELDEQILADGGHFERSPMYHAMILEDCLDLLNIMNGLNLEEVQTLRQQLRKKAEAMLIFLSSMTHPDGDIALFNDAALGIEARLDALADYFERLTGETAPSFAGDCVSFPDTGYFVFAPRAGNRLIVDCGPVGPDYQPGHAHCDTLSFELSLQGQRVIVDSGCCQYLEGEIRRYNRGNAGHNTVTIDGENQSEVWGAHRCARRARPLYGRLDKLEDGTLLFAGAHDGYRRLKGKPIHHRTIAWAGGVYRIEDRIEGQGSHDIESRLHIHPEFSVEVVDDCAMIRTKTDLLAIISSQDGSSLETTDGWYCPEFGIQQPCTVIISRFSQVPLPFRTGWVIKTSD